MLSLLSFCIFLCYHFCSRFCVVHILCRGFSVEPLL